MSNPHPFKWRHFEAEIILLCVRWYLRYALSYRDLEEMMRERGLSVDHTTIYRWVQHYAPELDKRSRPQLKAYNDSWKVDETYIKVRKTWMYLYRAVDSDGNTLEFLLSPRRDAEAATRFFVKALYSTASAAPGARPVQEQVEEPTALADPLTPTAAPRVITVEPNAAHPVAQSPAAAEPNPTRSAPRVINVDKNAASPKAIAELKAAGLLPESVELKTWSNTSITWSSKITASSNAWSSQEWASFRWKRQGERVPSYEAMHMIRKGQVSGVGKGDIPGQVTFVAGLFGVAA